VAKNSIFGLLLIVLSVSVFLSSCRKPEVNIPVGANGQELHDPSVIAMWKAQDTWLDHQRDGDFYIYVRRFDQARESFDSAIREARKSFGNDDPRLARSLTGLGRCFAARREYPAALLAFEEALKIKKAKYKNPSLDVADLLTELAHVRLGQSELAQARALINESNQLRKQISADSFSPETALVEALLLAREGKRKEAKTLYKKVENELLKRLAPTDELPPSTRAMTTLRECLDNYILSLDQDGDRKGVEELRKKLDEVNQWLVILGENGTM
jgi:tetratricopeptide (TPR) repeat protein